MDRSDMFVLMSLMNLCLQRDTVLCPGACLSSSPAKRAHTALAAAAQEHPNPIATLHAPTPELTP
jgi:hypothetical protein